MTLRIFPLLLIATFLWPWQARAQIILIKPDTINFGRVHIETQKDSFFTIVDSVGTTTIPTTNFSDSNADSDFTADTIKTSISLDPITHPYIKNNIHFKPSKEGIASRVFKIDSLLHPPLTLTVMGFGTRPQVASSGYDFGAVRVDDSTLTTLKIRNIGSEVTIVDSISILGGSDTNDFQLLDTLVLPGHPLSIAYNGDSVFYVTEHDSSGITIKDTGTTIRNLDTIRTNISIYDTVNSKHDTVRSLRVLFVPHTLGLNSLILRIHTTDGETIYDTLFGIGAEPLATILPKILNFGQITVTATTPLAIDTSFIIKNRGSYLLHLDTLTHSDSNFAIEAISNQDLDTGQSLIVYDTFKITQEGDFSDTVRLTNDTRYWLYGDSTSSDSIIVLTASVRTPPISHSPQALADTVRNCNTILDTLVLYNPYRVTARIDDIIFDSSSAGLALSPLHPFIYPIEIATDSIYQLFLAYNFPDDSLNGPQQMTLELVEHHSTGDSVGRATVTAYRKRSELTFHAKVPAFISSANDVSVLQLPITVDGPRAGVHELDNWKLSLTFSNDLFMPVGIDTAGGLVTAHDSTPFSLDTVWDQSARTYTVTVHGAKLSDSASIFNHLVFNIMMRAFLTMDTTVVVTPTLTFVSYPCAYTLQSFVDTISYANDCGDVTLRSFLSGERLPLQIAGLWPNPVEHGSRLSLSYVTSEQVTVLLTVTDALGRMTGSTTWQAAPGTNIKDIPSELLPPSGLALLSLDMRSQNGAPLGRRTLNVAISN